MKRDLINELNSEGITAEEAESCFHRWLDEGADQPDEIGLTPMEYTAFSQGINILDLANWRNGGWPRCVSIVSTGFEPSKAFARSRRSSAISKRSRQLPKKKRRQPDNDNQEPQRSFN